jgi:hypothetical protein
MSRAASTSTTTVAVVRGAHRRSLRNQLWLLQPLLWPARSATLCCTNPLLASSPWTPMKPRQILLFMFQPMQTLLRSPSGPPTGAIGTASLTAASRCENASQARRMECNMGMVVPTRVFPLSRSPSAHGHLSPLSLAEDNRLGNTPIDV